MRTSEFSMHLFYQIMFRVLLASMWVKCSITEGNSRECVSLKSLPVRLRQLENRLNLLPSLCKTFLTNESRASQDLSKIVEFCFHVDRSINYRYDVSRLGSQLECVGGKTGCATVLLPKAV